MLLWSPATLRSPRIKYGAGSCSASCIFPTRQMYVPQPSDEEEPRTCADGVDAAPTPRSIRQRSSPILLDCLYKLHRPTSVPAEETDLPDAQASALRRPDPEYQQDAPSQSAAGPWYRRLYDACGLSPSYQHHSREAPLFRRLHALAVYDRCAGRSLPPMGCSYPVAQGFMDSLPGSVLSPGAEVVKRRAPRGKVVRQHSPRAPTPKHVHDGVHHFSARVLDRTASGFGRRE